MKIIRKNEILCLTFANRYDMLVFNDEESYSECVYDLSCWDASVAMAELHHSSSMELLAGCSFRSLFFDTADEISDGKESPLVEASSIDIRNITTNGATRDGNASPYTRMRARVDSSKGCKLCDELSGRTRNTDSAKGQRINIADNGRERVLLKYTGDAIGKRVGFGSEREAVYC